MEWFWVLLLFAITFLLGVISVVLNTGADLVAALGNVEFAILRTKGSHHFLGHEDGRTTVVPVHSGETIGPGLLLKILRDCQITVEELLKLL